MLSVRTIAACAIVFGVTTTASAETALQAASLARSAASGAGTFCRIERVRFSACQSAEALDKAASAHYQAMMPADMAGAHYRWELASKRCENGCDDSGFALIAEAIAKYELLEFKYLSEDVRCKSEMDSPLCFRINQLQSKYAGAKSP
jgi:hypothetical protein